MAVGVSIFFWLMPSEECHYPSPDSRKLIKITTWAHRVLCMDDIQPLTPLQVPAPLTLDRNYSLVPGVCFTAKFCNKKAPETTLLWSRHLLPGIEPTKICCYRSGALTFIIIPHHVCCGKTRFFHFFTHSSGSLEKNYALEILLGTDPPFHFLPNLHHWAHVPPPEEKPNTNNPGMIIWKKAKPVLCETV